MTIFNTELGRDLASAGTKTQWGALYKALLNPGVRIRCFKSSNANAVDPSVDGVEFLNIGSDGNFTMVNGDIVGLGLLSGKTVHEAVDLNTGSACLRIESKDYITTCTLGLRGSGKEFMLSANLTGDADEGIAFVAGAGIKAPVFLPTGIGPAAPEMTADTVRGFFITDERDPANPVATPIAWFSHRNPNIVSDRLFIAREMGDVREMRCPDDGGIIFGTGGDCFKFAGSSYLMDKSVNADADVPWNGVEIRSVPHARWGSWPFKRDLDLASDVLFPWPHKIHLVRGDESVKDIIEDYSTRDANNTPGSGKAINHADQKQSQLWDFKVEEFSACTQISGWMSHRTKPNSMRNHLIPPVGLEAMHPTNVIQKMASQQYWPPITQTNTWDGWNVLRVAPKWPGTRGSFDTIIVDPYMVGLNNSEGHQVFSYAWKPGASCLHVMSMAPGGTRHDRGFKPTSVINYLTQPDGHRIHGHVPYVELMHEWIKGYWSHGCHLFTDVVRGYGIPKARLFDKSVCYGDVYYRGPNENYLPNIETSAVRLLSATAGNGSGVKDKYGRWMNNEYSRDYQHNQSNSSLGGYLMNNPMSMLEAYHFFTANILCSSWMLGRAFTLQDFMARQHAWYIGQYLDMWLACCSSDRSMRSSEIEADWQKHFEDVHDLVMPGYLSSDDIYFVTLRNLGIGSTLVAVGTDKTAVKLVTDSKSCYFGQVMMLMKQSGAWDVMYNKSAKCRAILDLMIRCMHKQTVDFFMDCNGRFDQRPYNMEYPNNAPVVPTDWGVYSPPFEGVDWIRRPDGFIKPVGGNVQIDNVNTMHYRAQQLEILKNHFSEYNYPRIDQAITKERNWYAEVEAGRVAKTNDPWTYRYSMMGIFAPPDYVGAPI